MHSRTEESFIIFWVNKGQICGPNAAVNETMYPYIVFISLQYLVQRLYCKTSLMENLISKYLPSELMERQKIYQEEMAELSK